MCVLVEIAAGADPDDAAADVVGVLGTQAEEQAPTGSRRSRTPVGARVS